MSAIAPSEIFSEKEWRQVVEDLELPPRQAQVIQHMLHGRSDKQIAQELGIAVPTVRAHVTRLFRRFELSDRIELVLHIVGHVHRRSKRNSPPTDWASVPRWLPGRAVGTGPAATR
jgi:DNA-binding CsgD family transcriptional regulator